MAPRVQTFAWRLLRNALATGKRVGKYSKHINETCSICGNLEDEMHLFFLCPFAKAAWYSSPWFIKTELLAYHNQSVPSMIEALITSNHPLINITSLYTFLWCIWKFRNDACFCRKLHSPSQVHAAAEAIMQGANLEVADTSQTSSATSCSNLKAHAAADASGQIGAALTHNVLPSPGKTIMDLNNIKGPIIFSDASWTPGPEGKPSIAGLGVFIQFAGDRICSKLCISATSPPVASAIQAEAFSMMLASQIAQLLHLQHATFITDCATLAAAVASQDPISDPGHWTIRPQLAHIVTSLAFNTTRIFHINRSHNFRAHHHARLALKIRSTFYRFRCLGVGNEACLNAVISALSTVHSCTIVHVRCC